MRALAVLFAALLLALPAPADARADVKRVSHDLGGPVDARLDEIAHLDADGTPVVIAGTCASACTLYLALETTCLAPGARLGFHAPTTDGPFGAISPRALRARAQQMADHYPAPMAAWFLDGPAWDLDGVTWLTAQQAERLGAKRC